MKKQKEHAVAQALMAVVSALKSIESVIVAITDKPKHKPKRGRKSK